MTKISRHDDLLLYCMQSADKPIMNIRHMPTSGVGYSIGPTVMTLMAASALSPAIALLKLCKLMSSSSLLISILLP